MITLDGSHGEGGGALVRVALALSAITGKAFTASKIRSGRKNPGLKPQHVFCVEGLKKICNGTATGAEIGSSSLTFRPGALESCTVSLDVGTAGSLTLLLQALLIPSILAPGKVHLKLRGGTDTQWAMPVDYFREVLLPHLRKYAVISCTMKQRGYYPAGNGMMDVVIKPQHTPDTIKNVRPINLLERGTLAHIKGISHASQELEQQRVAERMAAGARNALQQELKQDVPVRIQTEYCKTASPGAGITLAALFQNSYGEVDQNNPVILGGDALGEKGKMAEDVGRAAAAMLLAEINNGACVDVHLADNLIPFMALHPPSMIRTSTITPHTLTNIHVVEQFLPVKFKIEGNIVQCLPKDISPHTPIV